MINRDFSAYDNINVNTMEKSVYPSMMPTAPPAYNGGIYHVKTLPEVINSLDLSPHIDEVISESSGYEIIFVPDNSGSMRNGNRMRDLKDNAMIVCDIGPAADGDGMDIHFLNELRDPKTGQTLRVLRNIKCGEQIKHLFDVQPSGSTPLTNVVGEIMREYTAKPKIIIIATDGQPDNKVSFESLLMNRDVDRNRISILLCTDDKEVVRYWNRLDKEIPRLDVIRVYDKELKEVRKVQGRKFPYTKDDHIARLFATCYIEEYDMLDEKKVRLNKEGHIIRGQFRNKKKWFCF